jgi:DNA-binding XRE family transcriptional regulator
MPRHQLSDADRRRGEALAGRIAQARTRLGLTQDQLASRSGVRLDTLRAIEGRRTSGPNVFLVLDLAHVLGVSVEELDT